MSSAKPATREAPAKKKRWLMSHSVILVPLVQWIFMSSLQRYKVSFILFLPFSLSLICWRIKLTIDVIMNRLAWARPNSFPIGGIKMLPGLCVSVCERINFECNHTIDCNERCNYRIRKEWTILFALSLICFRLR